MGWYIRDKYDDFNPDRDYNGNPSLFSARIFYGGFFRRVPSRRYLQGRSVYVDYIDIDEFSVHEVDWMMRELKLLKEKVPLYYHFQIPGRDLDTGLVALGCDADVRNLSKYVGENKLINFYIEEGKSMVDTYLKSPEGSRVVIEELEEENQEIVGVRQNKKKLVPRRKLMLEYVEGSSSANKNTSNIEIETDNAVGNNDNAVGKNDNPVVNNDNPVGNNDNVKEGTWVDGFNFDDIDFSGEFTNNEGHKDNEGDREAEDEGHREAEGDREAEYEGGSEEEGDREAEDEGGSEDEGGNEADCSHQSENDGDDSEDSDYIVDNDYEVEEMEVDMRDFNVFVDEDEEFVGSRNSGINDDVRTEVDYENEIEDNLSYESFDSLTDESMEP